MSRAARTKIAHQDVELLETDQNTEDITQRAAAQYQVAYYVKCKVALIKLTVGFLVLQT